MENRKRIIELLITVRYTTNDIEKVADEICSLFNVVAQSEQLSCPKCDSTSIYSTGIEIYHDCNNCGHDWTT